MIIPFQQMNIFIINSFKPLYGHIFDNDNINITFTNYIKSQIHLNIVTDLYGRDLKIYRESLRYIKGDDECFASFCKTLKFFYSDIARMILNNINKDIHICIDVDITRDTILRKETIDLKNYQTLIDNVLSGEANTIEEMLILKQLNRFTLKQLSELKSSRFLSLAILLLNRAKEKDIVLLEMR